MSVHESTNGAGHIGGYGDYYGGDARFVDGGALIALLVVSVLCRDLGLCDLASSKVFHSASCQREVDHGY
ncbi:uncharacterized protein HKW66_Vig0249780 [Vigna angularis]|uniref:Uncharacterized protein n=1 Tax=Phaseolus angularis TaxID=3914 RepID=A0A8T0KU15_PHAAN|nr:uncharacterized protein HKW66_Vig0249780 [Vigna angularis]